MALKWILGIYMSSRLILFCWAPAACDFEKSLCSWSNTKGGDDFDWTRQSGGTTSDDTGPVYDHTYNNSRGSYVYMEASAPRRHGQKAILRSSTLWHLTSRSCFTFWYHMYGSGIGSLTVILDIEGLEKRYQIWSLSGNQGNSWRKGKIFLPVLPSERFNILIEGVLGNDFKGDIAVDDISTIDGSCIIFPDYAISNSEWFFDLRLVNGKNYKEGRVEIQYNGEWGTVCDDDWDQDAAAVVCRQLGYDKSNSVPKNKAFFGQGTGEIWLDNTNCVGKEYLLGRCKHSGFGKDNCAHSEDAGVICDGELSFLNVKLVNGSYLGEGRVEVYFNGEWGTVCDDDWGQDDAKVVCRQLGYDMSKTKAVSKSSSFFGRGSGNIWLDNVNCTGLESNLLGCSHMGFGNEDCGHSEDAGVICGETPSVHLVPRLSKYHIIKGEKLYLQCITKSIPVVQPNHFTWRRNNGTLNGKISSVLIITEPGIYKCTARNAVGEATTNSINVQVSYGPKITTSTDSLQIKEGSTNTLRCFVDSNPPPTTFLWYKPDGTNQSATQPMSISSRNQSGIYWCNASTTLISTNISTPNDVVKNGSRVDVIVYFIDPVKISSEQQTINENDDLNITCSTESNPTSSISWLNGSNVIETFYSTNISSLVKENANCFYTGNYSCKFVNAQFPNQEYTRTTSIYVTCSPRLDNRVPSTTKMIGKVNETVRLEVQVISYPEPFFLWYYLQNNETTLITNNKLFKQNDTQIDTMIFRSVLEVEIRDARLFRDYSLKAQHGSYLIDIITISLISQSVPDKVTGFKVMDVTEDSVCVEWKPGFNGGAVQEFTVEYRTYTSAWVNSSLDTNLNDENSMNYCITNLKPDTLYDTRIMSSNKYGSTNYIYIDHESLKTLHRPIAFDKTWLFKGLSIGISTFISIIICIIVIIMVVCIFKCGKRLKTNSENYNTYNSNAVANENVYEEISMSGCTDKGLNQNVNNEERKK